MSIESGRGESRRPGLEELLPFTSGALLWLVRGRREALVNRTCEMLSGSPKLDDSSVSWRYSGLLPRHTRRPVSISYQDSKVTILPGEAATIDMRAILDPDQGTLSELPVGALRVAANGLQVAVRKHDRLDQSVEFPFRFSPSNEEIETELGPIIPSEWEAPCAERLVRTNVIFFELGRWIDLAVPNRGIYLPADRCMRNVLKLMDIPATAN
jgi:hypothetical protein